MDLRRLLLKPTADRVARPLIARYLRRPRMFRGHGLVLQVPPGVFHPGLFFSSGAMARWLQSQDLAGETLLDLGTGSGVLGLVAAKQGADVTLLDLSPRALLAAGDNARRNGLRVRLLHSDGFRQVPAGSRWRWIIANPPWFPSRPPDEAGLAWYAGPELGWFRHFFAEVASHLAPGGRALMVVADSADLGALHGLAAEAGWTLTTQHRTRVLWEWQHVLELHPPGGADAQAR